MLIGLGAPVFQPCMKLSGVPYFGSGGVVHAWQLARKFKTLRGPGGITACARARLTRTPAVTDDQDYSAWLCRTEPRYGQLAVGEHQGPGVRNTR